MLANNGFNLMNRGRVSCRELGRMVRPAVHQVEAKHVGPTTETVFLLPIIPLNSQHQHKETGEVRLRYVPLVDELEACGDRKPRITEIRAIVAGPPDAAWVEPGGFVAFLSEGSIVSHSQVRTKVTYERPGKHAKVITDASTESGVTATCPNHVLLAYDVLLAVDTNSVEIDGVAVSVTFALQLALQRDGDGVQASGFNPSCWEFNGVTDHPENYAWREAIRALQASEGYSADAKVGVIVDSDLGNLGSFNDRQMPIHDDFFLPQNITLVYASAEVGTTEYAANGIMKYCDSQASKVLGLRRTHRCDALPAGRFRIYRRGNSSCAGPTSASTRRAEALG